MTGAVGILAYGSLIANPGDEILAVRTQVVTDLSTPFPVEYARTSTGRGGAPTLVPFDDGGAVQSQLFIVDCSVEDATDRIFRREIDKVGSGRQYTPSDNPGPNTVIVSRIDNFLNIEVVLYTRIEPTIPDPTPATLAVLAIDSVARTDSGRDGITYLMDAINAGISTPLTDDYAAEIMRRTGTGTLEEALASVRGST